MESHKLLLPAICILLSMLQAGTPLNACTTFFFKTGDSILFGRNYDWNIGVGFVMVNKRNYAKQALIYNDPSAKPAQWVSRYGSITFNQYGKEYPMGGMNEAGLVVEVMWLAETQYPGIDERFSINELQWVQYQLDTASSVAEVLESDAAIRIVAGSAPIHFLVSDRAGNVATVEFLNGKMVAHTGDSLPVPVLANDTYEASMQYLHGHKGFGGNRPIPATESSLDRFVRASEVLRSFQGSPTKDLVGFSFSLLSSVRQKRGTQWSIVYDVNSLTVHFKTRDAPHQRSFSFEDFEFGCPTASKIFDMNTDRSGDVAKYFVRYSNKINRRLIGESFRGTDFLKDTTEELLNQFAIYPESFPCRVKK